MTAGIITGSLLGFSSTPAHASSSFTIGVPGPVNEWACQSGYVWREARPEDLVCVTPDTRTQTRRENDLAASRRSPNGGIYGPNTCRSGFVWREAFEGDTVCVTPESRAQAHLDNSQPLKCLRYVQQDAPYRCD